VESLWFEWALLPDGWADGVRIRHAGGRIVDARARAPAQPGDERGAIALPGLGNIHSHAFQRGMAGLAEIRGPASDDFWTWREVMYRFLDRLGPEEVEAIAALAYAEMLESGFTRVGEFHYLHHDPDGAPYGDPAELACRIAAAAEATGIALTLLPVFYAHGNFAGAAPSPGQRRFINATDGFARLMEASRQAVRGLTGAVVGVAPHSLRAVTPQELSKILPLAGDGPIHIHAAEQVREVEDCVAWAGRRPVEWLLDEVGVDARWCVIHATHLTDAETDGLAASGAVAGLCPITEANLGDGVFPAERYLSRNGAFGVGTDSNVLIDAAGELRGLEYAQRLTRRARNVLAPREGYSVGRALFEEAVKGGARALGVDRPALEAGARADIVALDGDHPTLAGRGGDALLDGWIFAAQAGAVDRVWRDGRKVVAGGRHVSKPAILEAYRKVLGRVLA
jgi:formimidoylglutamate deiminase